MGKLKLSSAMKTSINQLQKLYILKRGTSWNKMEPPRASQNELKPPRTSWSQLDCGEKR